MQAWIGLGGNLGDAVATLHAALQDLDNLPQTRLVRASKLYRTPAWGVVEQPDFINAVALLDTRLPPRDLLDALLGIERAFGRERHGSERWGPRVLDLDLLLYDSAVIDEPGLRVPHPHLHERAFALLPLVEITPDAFIPGIARAADALRALDSSAIEDVG
jgi:2-amino-4-hydroxy-6-hydroxymethyldihydropteridine diphosphokinase